MFDEAALSRRNGKWGDDGLQPGTHLRGLEERSAGVARRPALGHDVSGMPDGGELAVETRQREVVPLLGAMSFAIRAGAHERG